MSLALFLPVTPASACANLRAVIWPNRARLYRWSSSMRVSSVMGAGIARDHSTGSRPQSRRRSGLIRVHRRARNLDSHFLRDSAVLVESVFQFVSDLFRSFAFD